MDAILFPTYSLPQTFHLLQMNEFQNTVFTKQHFQQKIQWLEMLIDGIIVRLHSVHATAGRQLWFQERDKIATIWQATTALVKIFAISFSTERIQVQDKI